MKNQSISQFSKPLIKAVSSFFALLLCLSLSLPAHSLANPLTSSSFFQRYLQPQTYERLNQVLFFVHNQYVDPKRVDFSEMFLSAAKELSARIAELTLTIDDSDTVLVHLPKQEKEFSKKVVSIFGLRNQLNGLLGFVLEHKESLIEDHLVEEAAINGVLKTLDPHSGFLSKEVLTETNVDIEGKFGGLGIVIGIRDGNLTVISPMDGTPASRAGIMAGDHITKIEKELTIGMSLTEAVSKMRGPKGTPITIHIMRETMEKETSYTIVRDVINVINIESALLDNNIGYIQLKRFDKNSAKEITHELQTLQAQAKKPLSGLILDLRNNPGGLLDQSIEVADLFLNQGIIVSTVERGNRAGSKSKAKSSNKDFLSPMVVLVNQGSASASEIVAGALQKNNRALIIGQTTFGKGTVQKIYELPEFTALKLTVSKYLTADDASIQSVGITPDIETQPIWIKDETIAFYEFMKKRSEESLNHHFEKEASKSKALTRLSYLFPMKEDANSEETLALQYQFGSLSNEKKQEKLFEAFEVTLAHQILSHQKNPKIDRLTLFDNSKKLFDEIQEIKQQEIQNALLEKNLDWTYPPNQKSDCNPKELTIQVHLDTKQKMPITPGQSIDILSSVNNPSSCTLYQVKAVTASKNPHLNQQFIYLGKIEPGQTFTKRKTIEIPTHQASGAELLTFTFSDANAHIQFDRELAIVFDTPKKPYYMAKMELSKKSDQKHELSFELHNQGSDQANEILFQIKQKGLKTFDISPSRHVIENLRPGKSEKQSFKISHTDAIANNEMFEIQILDIDHHIVIQQDFSVKNLKKSLVLQAPQISLDPNLNQIVDQDTFTLKGAIQDDAAVKDMYVFVNEEKYIYRAFEGKNKEEAFSVTIPLTDGQNRIEIIARDHQETESTKAFRVVKKPQAQISSLLAPEHASTLKKTIRK